MKKLFLVTLAAICTSSLSFAQSAPVPAASQTDAAKFAEIQRHILGTLILHKACVERSKTLEDLERCRPGPPQRGSNQENPNGPQGAMR